MKCNLTNWHISRAISTVHVVLYNNCLHMRWTLKVVNPRALAQGKITSQWSTTWCSSHMKAITISLNWNYSNMFITWMFCFAEDNKIISGIENTIMEPDWKNMEFQHTSSCQGLLTGRQPIVSLYIIYALVVHRVVSLINKFSKKHLNYLTRYYYTLHIVLLLK
jgi:hypothetical protein